MTPWTLAVNLMQLPPPVSTTNEEAVLSMLRKRDNTLQGIRVSTGLKKLEVEDELRKLEKRGKVRSRQELRGKNVVNVWSLVKENTDE
jgi:predicted Rossmann fold nucleotide-binding protein DprA/Smf involved in DNA uptake